MNNKQAAFAGLWNRYLPVIRILVKRAMSTQQVIDISRSDLERAAGIRKTGYRFLIHFISDKPEPLETNSDFAQAFIAVIPGDEVIRKYLLNNNYTFSFSGKYQLQITNTPDALKKYAAHA